MTFLIPPKAWALALVGVAQLSCAQSQGESTGLLEDSSTKLVSRNFYFNRDFRSEYGPTSLRQEWAQGFILDFKSGYTQGVVGVGLDAYGMLGLKLDGSRGRSPLMLLPIDGDGNPEHEWAKAGGALKVRWSNTELKYGNLMPLNPVFAMSSARLFPSSAEGFQLLNSDLSNLSYIRFRTIRRFDNANVVC